MRTKRAGADLPDPLSPAERAVLSGSRPPELALPAAFAERQRGLAALAGGDDLAAVASLRRSRDLLEPGGRDWAVSERLHGLAMIRALREVEGSFALERADAVLDALGLARFELDA